MDLNELLHRHQVSLMQADRAACIEARHAHRNLAAGYADRIARMRISHGVKPTPMPISMPTPMIVA